MDVDDFNRMFARVVVGQVMAGMAIALLWSWFIAPRLGGRGLSVVEAAALNLVGQLMIWRPRHRKAKTEKGERTFARKWADTLVAALRFPLLAMCAGWIYKQFL